MRRIRTLFVVRPDLFTNPGGDTTQISETRNALEHLGIRVTIHLAEATDRARTALVREHDIVHAFNLLLAHQFGWIPELARSERKPFFLSPVFWDTAAYERAARAIPRWKSVIAGMLNGASGAGIHGWMIRHLKSVAYNVHYRAFLAEVLRATDTVLPNSRVEVDELRRIFDTSITSHIVPNGCRVPDDEAVYTTDEDGPFVLCVGRVERRKNQLGLVRALEGMALGLVFVGNVNLAEKQYWQRCKDEAVRRGVRIRQVGAVPLEVLWGWYRAAAVHAQPSWFETPGLTSLEAAAAGCPIVCTRVGSAPEYFGDSADYCDPASPRDIRDAIARALVRSCESVTALGEFVRDRYTWERAGRETALAYRRLTDPTERTHVAAPASV